MTNTPLHVHSDTHLYDGAFPELIAGRLSGDESILLAAPDSETRTAILEAVRESCGRLDEQVEVYEGDQSELPFDTDTFDVAIHYNPNRGVLQRHLPLYEMTAVVRERGTVIYRAPNYLAHSSAAEIDTLYALGWSDHQDPTVAGVLTVTTSGDPRDSASQADTKQTATLGDF
jgi:hypothetical protein